MCWWTRVPKETENFQLGSFAHLFSTPDILFQTSPVGLRPFWGTEKAGEENYLCPDVWPNCPARGDGRGYYSLLFYIRVRQQINTFIESVFRWEPLLRVDQSVCSTNISKTMTVPQCRTVRVWIIIVSNYNSSYIRSGSTTITPYFPKNSEYEARDLKSPYPGLRLALLCEILFFIQ